LFICFLIKFYVDIFISDKFEYLIAFLLFPYQPSDTNYYLLSRIFNLKAKDSRELLGLKK